MIAFIRSRSKNNAETGPWLSCSKSGVEVRQERSAIVQPGQIIVFGEEPKLLFGLDTRLNCANSEAIALSALSSSGFTPCHRT